MNRNKKLFEYAMDNTEILRFPKQNLTTFGVTNIHYYLLTELKFGKTRIREGKVISEKPKIIVPKKVEDIFKGFGRKEKEYAKMLFGRFGSDLRIFEYKFKNELKGITIESCPLDEIFEKIDKRIDEQALTTIIKGVENAWQLSLMKFIVEITLKSFYSNITELAERGFFAEKKGFSKREEIEKLFKQAKKDKSKIDELGRKLTSFGLFEEYEDRFFALFKNK